MKNLTENDINAKDKRAFFPKILRVYFIYLQNLIKTNSKQIIVIFMYD